MLLAAWFGAHDGDPADAAKNPGDGNLHAASNTGAGGDYVVITGDWVYDAGHDGWNEFHPAKSVQKIPNAPYWQEGGSKTDVDNFKTVLAQWCGAIAVVVLPGVQDAQKQPENRWTLHPDVDGCQPSSPPDIR